MMEGQFNIKRDISIVNNGGFFCEACLVGKAPEEQSIDPRYCQSCYDFLMEEAKQVTRWKTPEWVPVVPRETFRKPVQSVLEGNRSVGNGDRHTVKMSTLKRGYYKKKNLPEDYIRQLADDGMGSKAIATKLETEHDIAVSYKTIQRILSSERSKGEGIYSVYVEYKGVIK